MNKKNIFISSVVVLIIVGIGSGVYFFTRDKGIEPADSNVSEECNISEKQEESKEAGGQTSNEKSQVQVIILEPGDGPVSKSGDTVTVDYEGTLENGIKFDSSIDRGEPFIFTLGAGRVITGWEIGVQEMKVGEKRKLIIPPELAYGERGVTGVIPPNATLIFQIELLGINE